MKRKVQVLLLAFGVSLGANAQVVQLPGGASEYNPTEALVVTTSQTLQLPDDGVLAYTSITIQSDVSLKFSRPASGLNPPVRLLATGPIIMGTDAEIDVSAVGRIAGPGGFNGARADGVSTAFGEGPGGGPAYRNGVYATLQPDNDKTYGNALIYPLIGGSGSGSGTASFQHGGGGGGAILIASDTEIRIGTSASILAKGSVSGGGANRGSGGSIRLVAPTVTFAGGSFLDAAGTSPGRIRVDTIDPGLIDQARLRGVKSVGSVLFVDIPNPPKLTILEAAGTAIPPGTPTLVTLPDGTPSTQSVTVKRENIPANLEVYLIVRPTAGAATRTDAITFDANGEGSINVEIPPNITTHIEAYTRPSPL